MGGREHRLIAYIAEAHLTPRTRQVLDRYLDQSIVEYSTWMDRYRTAPGYEITTYWHMVTIDKDGNVPPEPLRPNGDGDAVRQLTRAIERLRNYRELSDSTVNVNLKYVIHLVGEMHCPGHIYFADLPGGMDAPRHYDFFLLKYKGKEVTYHWVWDGSVSRQYPDWTEEDFRRELDKWPAEKQRAVGEGFLSTTSGARMRLDTEYDTRYAQDGDGKAMRVNAALRLDSDTRDWFRFDNRGRMSGAEAIVVETSTEGVEGRGLSFDFSFLAGNHDINRSWGYPVEWKVEYSADGLPFIDAGRIFVLRPVVYNDAVIKDLGLRRLSYDAALGFTEYSVPLPVSLLGHKRLTVRLTPASAVMATIPENPADDSAGGVVTADFRQPFVLRLGRVAVRALR